MNKKLKYGLIGLACFALVAGGVLLVVKPAQERSKAQGQESKFLTQAVSLGEIKRTVNASGSLKPLGLVEVGTQVSGTVKTLLVDYNSEVRAGQLLAELDPTLLDADLAQVAAQQRSAQSSLELAQTRLARSAQLFEQGFVARAEVDEAVASVKSAQASLDQFAAGVARASKNRCNTQIVSPVSGTVVSREVQVGQTVAASLQTPVLFKIAKDLRAMQIEVNVSEADVGFMREGQAVGFTVDAFADRSFSGMVHQVRNNPITQQNVVTYTMIVHTRNDDLSLRPGMTAYVNVTVAERQQALRLPNAALRYTPASAPQAQGQGQAGPSNQRTVWKLNVQTGQTEALPVTLGIADGKHTELLSAQGLKSGDALVIGERMGPSFSGPKIF